MSPRDNAAAQLLSTFRSSENDFQIDHMTDQLSYNTPPKYPCFTEIYLATSIHDVQVGHVNALSTPVIPIWKPGSTVTYTIDIGTFPSPGHLATATIALASAAQQWNDSLIPVNFRSAGPGEHATFVLKYGKRAGNVGVLASAFLPDHFDPTMYIYPLAFTTPYRRDMDKVFQHELGHVLGLRHEFAATSETHSVQIGSSNSLSVMNYHSDLNFGIQPLDVEGLKALYKLKSGQFINGFKVDVLDPEQ
ncbi:metallopeptidase catalytic domain-containing protein [Fusarium mundagurra]|uniref:Metallopeptidase catalytic domain-containing protein n=1 Tax=Fusarium mundagurra TaxID=1567541 RepID=A0A8H6DPR4_9HYPO|nr:metallopeptidase catalytic domain-containing protein [Fusarium mundagurra]